MTSAPYLRFYVGDYLADTTHLTRGEHGAYTLLLWAMWRAGGKLPAVDAKLARIAKCTPREWEGIKPTILAFFTRKGGALTHKRITAELENYRRSIERQSEGGRKGGLKTASKNKQLRSSLPKGDLKQSEPEAITEPFQGSGNSLADASSRSNIRVVAERPFQQDPPEVRAAMTADLLGRKGPALPIEGPSETQAEVAARLLKSLGKAG